jgi:hypothetical protein
VAQGVGREFKPQYHTKKRIASCIPLKITGRVGSERRHLRVGQVWGEKVLDGETEATEVG